MSSDSLRVALYARVSTKEQDTTAQKDRLYEEANRRGWEIVGYFEDVGVSGKNDNRPEYQKMLKLAGIEKNKITRSKIDVIAVTKLDRMMRSLTHLENTINLLDSQNVGLLCLDQGIDTASGGINQRLVRQILGAVAEWERQLIRERVTDGIEKAKIHGTKSGKPFGRPDRDIPDNVIEEIEGGLSLRKASAKFGIPLSTLSDCMKKRRAVADLENGLSIEEASAKYNIPKETLLHLIQKRSKNIPLKNEAPFIYSDLKTEGSGLLKDCEQFSNEEKEQPCHKI